jgi:hypothetical protein
VSKIEINHFVEILISLNFGVVFDEVIFDKMETFNKMMASKNFDQLNDGF